VLLNTVGVPQFLSGGNGNDSLTSGNGRDILVGGRGADSLRSNGGEDILAAGEYGLPLIGADELLRFWTGKPRQAARITALADDERSPFSATTIADTETDALRGDGSNDLFLVSESDTLFKPGRKEPRRVR
jgi:Ca2+-binding RTX toxin-like protein